MAGKRREEAKRTQAIEAAAESQGEILARLETIEAKIDALFAAATKPVETITLPPAPEPTPTKSKAKS